MKADLIEGVAIKARAPEAAQPLVVEIVALAKSEVHAMMDDREAAADEVLDRVVGAVEAAQS